MTQYLISFDARAMDHVASNNLPAVGAAAHAVAWEAGTAGVLVFAGLLQDPEGGSVVKPDGTVTAGTPEMTGGAVIIDVPSRDVALEWAAKIAVACRCAQEVREFIPDPELDAMLRVRDDFGPTCPHSA